MMSSRRFARWRGIDQFPIGWIAKTRERRIQYGIIHGIYLGWTWNLDGTLRNATLYDGKPGVRSVPQNRNADLREIRSAVWQCTVFINLSGDAQSFKDCIAPVEDLYANVDLSTLTPGTSKDGTEVVIDRYTFESNWKSVYENFGININHEGFVHREFIC